MSLETWREAFYPKPAYECSESEALAHSIQKWVGLQKANLRKHGLTREPWDNVVDPKDGGSAFGVNSGSCALCHYYLAGPPLCSTCPLYKLLGEECDAGSSSPYQHWDSTGDTRPMLRALRKALAVQQQTK